MGKKGGLIGGVMASSTQTPASDDRIFSTRNCKADTKARRESAALLATLPCRMIRPAKKGAEENGADTADRCGAFVFWGRASLALQPELGLLSQRRRRTSLFDPDPAAAFPGGTLGRAL